MGVNIKQRHHHVAFLNAASDVNLHRFYTNVNRCLRLTFIICSEVAVDKFVEFRAELLIHLGSVSLFLFEKCVD